MTTSVESVADLSTKHARPLRLMTWFVRVAGVYNANAGTIFGVRWALGRTHRKLLTIRLAA